MKYGWDKFKEEAQEVLAKAIIESKILGETNVDKPDDLVIVDIVSNINENPPSNVLADLAFPCFVLTKKFNCASPAVIAKKLVEAAKAKKSDWKYVGRVEESGSFVNFIADDQYFSREIVDEILNTSDCYGSMPGNGNKIGIEYVSPNTNKPLHLGHARNAFLGSALSRIAGFAGDEVLKFNLFNDRGIHICKSMLAYQKWGDDQTPETLGLKPDHFVGKYYQMFEQKAHENPALEDEAQAMLKSWENGDEQVRGLWQKMNSWFFTGAKQTLQRVGADFDKIYLESEIYTEGKQIIEQALSNGKCYRLPDGAIEADLEEKKLGKKILLRQDGTAVYIVQDLFLAKKKFEDFALDLSVYVVADEQKYHFDVLFELLDRFGIADRTKNYHLAYGMVDLAEGKMSSRRGTVINIDDILNELRDLASKEILARESDLGEEEVKERAEKIAQAALKYKILATDKDKKIVFDKQEALRFEGETGPYLLYVYARIASILTKAGEIDFQTVEWEKDNREQRELVLILAQFNRVIKSSREKYNPGILARYLFALCQNFNMFYHQHRIIDIEDQGKKMSRLLLVKATQQVLRNGLDLLGIEVLNKM